MRKFDLDELREFISNQSPTSKIYIGCDSFRKRNHAGKWFAHYTVVVVVHMNGRNGCRVFGDITSEPDYDQNKSRPAMRLMNEVYKAVEMLGKISDVLGDREVSLHLDINKDPKHGSSCVVDQAIGYVKGTTGLTPLIKPEGFAATHCADHFREYASQFS